LNSKSGKAKSDKDKSSVKPTFRKRKVCSRSIPQFRESDIEDEDVKQDTPDSDMSKHQSLELHRLAARPRLLTRQDYYGDESTDSSIDARFDLDDAEFDNEMSRLRNFVDQLHDEFESEEEYEPADSEWGSEEETTKDYEEEYEFPDTDEESYGEEEGSASDEQVFSVDGAVSDYTEEEEDDDPDFDQE